MKIRYRVRSVRLYTIIGFIVLASVIFICFQLFSAQVLQIHSKEENRRSKAKLIDIELAKENLLPVHDQGCIDGFGMGCHSKVETPDFPRGVSFDLRDQYVADTRNMFTCLHSKMKIPYSRVNDDYCDCDDSSDEPGTSACPDSRFYCHFQFSWSDPEWYRSSRVNDGICDCCDGSDEWRDLPLPVHVKIEDRVNKYYVRQTPCIDQCQVKKTQLESRIKLREEGRKLQKQYLEAAKQIANPEALYGPNGIFYSLSSTCFEGHFDKYTYRVCPFRKVEQINGPVTTVIGRDATWQVCTAEKYELKMTNGDGEQCPQKKKRLSVINLTCGLEDKVVSVHEFEVCEYLVEFSTPAAC